MKTAKIKQQGRQRRKQSVRTRMRRRSDRPRLSVNRSLKHISAQVIDDASGRTLCSATSTAKALAGELAGKNKTQRAALIGAEIARRAVAAGVETVVFDRGAARYHGRIKALAEAAREGGLKF
jgi:large subunit ribosomal protein L18